jgi:hypothetical protein
LLASAIPIWQTTHGEVERQLADVEPKVLRRGLGRLS